MVSHITLYSPCIANPSLRYLDLILSKTRFSSHISFLSLRFKVIPNGFKSSFNLYAHSPNNRHTVTHRVNKVRYEHSRRLMRIAIDSMSDYILTLDSHISHAKSFLFSICPAILRQDITHFVRLLNSFNFFLSLFQEGVGAFDLR